MFLRLVELFFILFVFLWATIDIFMQLVLGRPLFPILRYVFNRPKPVEVDLQQAQEEYSEAQVKKQAEEIRKQTGS